MQSARDKNIVVTARAGEFSEAMRLLEPFGRVNRTDYWNVLVVTVDDFQIAVETVSRQAGLSL